MSKYYSTTWQCTKCGAMISTRQNQDGCFWTDTGRNQLNDGPCPAGGDHDWHEITKGIWSED